MEHVYLTKEEIETARKLKQITSIEEKELMKRLKNDSIYKNKLKRKDLR